MHSCTHITYSFLEFFQFVFNVRDVLQLNTNNIYGKYMQTKAEF